MRKVRMTVVVEYEPDLSPEEIRNGVDAAAADQKAYDEGHLTVDEVLQWNETDPDMTVTVKFENVA